MERDSRTRTVADRGPIYPAMETTVFPGGIDEQMPAIDGSHAGARQLTAGYCQLKRSMV
jgi:hypothetical protein